MKSIIIVVFALINLHIATSSESSKRLSVVNIGCCGREALDSLKDSFSSSEGSWWIELGGKLLVASDEELLVSARSQGFSVESVAVPYDGIDSLILVQRAHPLQSNELNDLGQVILSASGFSIVKRSVFGRATLPSAEFKVIALTPNKVLVSKSCNTREHSGNRKRQTDPDIQDLVDSISQSRWTTDLQYLSSLNRHISQPGIATAKSYIYDQLSAISGITVSTQSFTVQSTPCENVIGWLPGATKPDEWIIVGAHYDSISQSISTAAPGAEDNGSGTVSVLELARIFASNPPDMTMIFILFSGEEEGLYGSIKHSQSIISSGNKSRVVLAHTMDMVGYRAESSDKQSVLLETSSAFSNFFASYASAAESYTVNELETETSTNPFGSDHVPYIERDIPAILIIDGDWDIYPYYHMTSDTFNKVNLPIAMDILRMNVATLAMIANDSQDGGSAANKAEMSVLFAVVSVAFFIRVL